MSLSSRKAWEDAVLEYSTELKMPTLRKYFKEHIKIAAQKDISYEEFLAG